MKIFLTSFTNVLTGRERTLTVTGRRDETPLERNPDADENDNILWRP